MIRIVDCFMNSLSECARRIGMTGVAPIVCVADPSGSISSGSTNSHSGGLMPVPGKVFDMIAGII
jgi:hypothetical protein